MVTIFLTLCLIGDKEPVKINKKNDPSYKGICSLYLNRGNFESSCNSVTSSASLGNKFLKVEVSKIFLTHEQYRA